MAAQQNGGPGKPTEVRTKLTKEEWDYFRLLRLRATSAKGQPYCAAALFKLVPVMAPGLGTFAVDKHWRVYMDFDWAREVDEHGNPKRDIAYMGGVLVHEVWHVLRHHSQRAEAMGGMARNHMAWNICADAEINDDIKGIVPKDSVFPSSLKDDQGNPMPEGQTAEWYFSRLPRNADSSDGGTDFGDGQGGPGKGGDGDGDKDGSSPGGSGKNRPDTNGVGPCGGGSGTGNTPIDGEITEAGAANVSHEEQEVAIMQVAKAVQEAAAKNAGSVPAGMRRWADDVLTAKPVPWQRVLRGHVKSDLAASIIEKKDYSRKHPSRRQPIKGTLLPSLRGPLPKIGLAFDTSGSVSQDELSLAISEVKSIARKVGVQGENLQAFGIDTVAGEARRVRTGRDVVLSGGGGTDMGVAIPKFQEMRCDVGIIFTDGATPWPKERPRGVRIIVVLIGSHAAHYAQHCPSWSKVVVIEEAGRKAA